MPRGVRWAGLLVLAAAAGLLAFTLVSLRHPPSYAAQATLQVVSAPGGSESSTESLTLAGALAQTYQISIVSTSVLSDVIGELHLHTTPDDLRAKIVTGRVPGTNLLTITGYGSTGPDAARLANTVASAFIRRTEQEQAAPLAAQRADLTARLAANEQALQTALTRQALLRSQPPTPAQQTELGQLDATISDNVLNRAGLQDDLATLREQQALDTTPARLVDPATPPAEPTAVLGAFSLGVAALVGGLAAVLALIALTAAAGTLGDAAEARTALGLPVLGVIPRGK